MIVLGFALVAATTAVAGAYQKEPPIPGEPKAKPPEIFSVPEFQAMKPRWSNLAAIGVTVTVEGRLISRFDTGLRLYKCDVRFIPPRGEKLDALPKKTTNVVVSGTLVKMGNRYRVIVKSLKERPNDELTFIAMQRKLPYNQSAPWYAAGKWAADRGRFYDDAKLSKLADAAYQRAVGIEQRELPAGDHKAVFRLAAKAKNLGVPAAAVQALTHLGYRTRWSQADSSDQPFGYAEFLAALAKDLPGADVPLKSVPKPLSVKYEKSPQSTYEAADAATRKTLHRLLYIEVAWRQINGTLNANRTNGFEVAAEIEKRLPEYRDRAEPLRKAELDYRVRTVASATRAEAVALADLLRERKSPQQAADALQSWVKAREPRWRKEGPTGLLLLAEATEKLLVDKKRTVEILLEAARQSPESAEIAKRLNGLGYENRAGIWVSAATPKVVRPDPLLQAVREGTVVAGMTPMQVRRVMAGTAKSIHRAATSGTINEVWLFQRADGSRLAVHFRRERHQTRAQARVTAVSKFPAR